MKTMKTRAEQLGRKAPDPDAVPRPTPATQRPAPTPDGRCQFARMLAFRRAMVAANVPKAYKDVLTEAALHVWRGTNAFASPATIAHDLGYTNKWPRVIYKAFDWAESHGLMTLQRGVRGRSGKAIVSYDVLWPDPVVPDADTTGGSTIQDGRLSDHSTIRVGRHNHPSDGTQRTDPPDPNPEKNEERRSCARVPSPLRSQEDEAVATVRRTCPDFDDKALVRRFLTCFGLGAVRRVVEDVAHRKPGTMKNRSAYLSVCLTNEVGNLAAWKEAREEQDALDYETAVEDGATWMSPLLPPAGWTPRTLAERPLAERPVRKESEEEVLQRAADAQATAWLRKMEREEAAIQRAVAAEQETATLRSLCEMSSRPSLTAGREASEKRRIEDAAAEQRHAQIELYGPLSPEGD